AAAVAPIHRRAPRATCRSRSSPHAASSTAESSKAACSRWRGKSAGTPRRRKRCPQVSRPKNTASHKPERPRRGWGRGSPAREPADERARRHEKREDRQPPGIEKMAREELREDESRAKRVPLPGILPAAVIHLVAIEKQRQQEPHQKEEGRDDDREEARQ